MEHLSDPMVVQAPSSASHRVKRREYDPGWHATHASRLTIAPTVGPYSPSEQDAQAELPGEGAYVPALHEEQDERPTEE